MAFLGVRRIPSKAIPASSWSSDAPQRILSLYIYLYFSSNFLGTKNTNGTTDYPE
jgi:hypothetical protein